jgi:urease accessory protein
MTSIVSSSQSPIASFISSQSPANSNLINDFHLYLRIGHDQNGQSFVSRQYATHPFRLSQAFYLDSIRSGRAYLYQMNTSPGVMAGDDLRIGVDLANQTKLHLTDQSATKVHSMPIGGLPSQVSYDITIGENASLEFIPEPLILYADSRLTQTTRITLHPTGQLCWSEIILPGRLAHQEYYQFHSYRSRLRVSSPEGELLFGETMLLEGMNNPLKDSFLFADRSVLATVIVVLPEANLDDFIQRINSGTAGLSPQLLAGNSRLPNCNSLIIRLMSDRVTTLKAYIQTVVNCVREINHQSLFPNLPK